MVSRARPGAGPSERIGNTADNARAPPAAQNSLSTERRPGSSVTASTAASTAAVFSSSPERVPRSPITVPSVVSPRAHRIRATPIPPSDTPSSAPSACGWPPAM